MKGVASKAEKTVSKPKDNSGTPTCNSADGCIIATLCGFTDLGLEDLLYLGWGLQVADGCAWMEWWRGGGCEVEEVERGEDLPDSLDCGCVHVGVCMCVCACVRRA